MITLCKDKDTLLDALEQFSDCEYLRTMILLYLHSYGCTYDFAEFYLQLCYNDCTSVVLRYNNTVYVLCSETADDAELYSFLCGFTGCEVFANRDFTNSNLPCVHCCIFSKTGEESASFVDVLESDNPREVSQLVCADLDENAQTEYFLNLSHMIRHNTLRAFCKYIDRKPVCAVSASCFNIKYSVINFAFTDSYFRGKGYCREVLNTLCSNPQTTYLLACEQHNVPFYEKCNFTHIADCVKYNF